MPLFFFTSLTYLSLLFSSIAFVLSLSRCVYVISLSTNTQLRIAPIYNSNQPATAQHHPSKTPSNNKKHPDNNSYIINRSFYATSQIFILSILYKFNINNNRINTRWRLLLLLGEGVSETGVCIDISQSYFYCMRRVEVFHFFFRCCCCSSCARKSKCIFFALRVLNRWRASAANAFDNACHFTCCTLRWMCRFDRILCVYIEYISEEDKKKTENNRQYKHQHNVRIIKMK